MHFYKNKYFLGVVALLAILTSFVMINRYKQGSFSINYIRAFDASKILIFSTQTEPAILVKTIESDETSNVFFPVFFDNLKKTSHSNEKSEKGIIEFIDDKKPSILIKFYISKKQQIIHLYFIEHTLWKTEHYIGSNKKLLNWFRNENFIRI
jgi:hypothetical protein